MNSSYSSSRPSVTYIASAARNWIHSVSQAAAMTFVFSSVHIYTFLNLSDISLREIFVCVHNNQNCIYCKRVHFCPGQWFLSYNPICFELCAVSGRWGMELQSSYRWANFPYCSGDLQPDAISTSSRQSAVSSSRGGMDGQSAASSSVGGGEDSQSVASSGRGGGGGSSLTSGTSQLTLEDNWRPQNSLPSYSQVWPALSSELFIFFIQSLINNTELISHCIIFFACVVNRPPVFRPYPSRSIRRKRSSPSEMTSSPVPVPKLRLARWRIEPGPLSRHPSPPGTA